MKKNPVLFGVLCAVFCVLLLTGCPGGLLGAPSVVGTWKYTMYGSYYGNDDTKSTTTTETSLTFGELANGAGTFKYTETYSNPKATLTADQAYEKFSIEGTYKLSNGVDWAQGVMDITVSKMTQDERETSYVDGKTTATHTMVSVPYDEAVPIHGLYAFDAYGNLLLAWNEGRSYSMSMDDTVTYAKE